MSNQKLLFRMASVSFILLCCTAASCEKAPPYSYSMGSVDTKSEQAPALIVISNPQIFARETLADDRRREAEYIEQLLMESKTAVFEPQLQA